MNMSIADFAEMSVHIKEEPIDYETLTHEIIIEPDVSVKDEPVEEEYDESPSPSTLQCSEEDMDIVTDAPLSHFNNDDPCKCCICDNIFSSESNRRRHQIDIHYCDKNYVSGRRRNQVHLQDRSVHPNIKLSPNRETNNIVLMCEICDLMFTSKEQLIEHKLAHETMPVLESVYASKGEVADKGKKKFTCKRCEKQYESYKSLRQHNRQKHLKNKSPLIEKFHKKCRYCDKIFHTVGWYIKHRRMHERNNEISQTEPHETMPTLFGEQSDFPIEFTCDVCMQTFTTRMALKKHKEKHAAEILLIVKNKQHRKQQKSLQKKDENNNCACGLCGKTFNSATARRVHQGWHNRGKNGGKTNNKTRIATAVEVKKEPLKTHECLTSNTACLPYTTGLQIHIPVKQVNGETFILPGFYKMRHLDFGVGPTQTIPRDGGEANQSMYTFPLCSQSSSN